MLRGNYDPKTTYDVGDVVVADNKQAYQLQYPAKNGTPPVNTRYWGRASQSVEQCALMILDNNVEIRKQLNAMKKLITALEKKAKGGAS